ncbi:hypothetical protein O181_010580 [Austropuccinia psidii MF-1]|uniref:Uncharacterized protein n=1 Tax=Austropuccinia psidii MF-1 TaxID=1389203 RepID=A0A9Q3BU56_9BASI|nr:hypothetical protein [Austropuccinia psidii MF-1]
MTQPHLKDFEFPRDYPLQKASAIRRNEDLRGKEVEADQSHRIWKNEPSPNFQYGLQQKASRRGLHRIRTFYSYPSSPQRTYLMENVRQEVLPRVPL